MRQIYANLFLASRFLLIIFAALIHSSILDITNKCNQNQECLDGEVCNLGLCVSVAVIRTKVNHQFQDPITDGLFSKEFDYIENNYGKRIRWESNDYPNFINYENEDSFKDNNAFTTGRGNYVSNYVERPFSGLDGNLPENLENDPPEEDQIFSYVSLYDTKQPKREYDYIATKPSSHDDYYSDEIPESRLPVQNLNQNAYFINEQVDLPNNEIYKQSHNSKNLGVMRKILSYHPASNPTLDNADDITETDDKADDNYDTDDVATPNDEILLDGNEYIIKLLPATYFDKQQSGHPKILINNLDSGASLEDENDGGENYGNYWFANGKLEGNVDSNYAIPRRNGANNKLLSRPTNFEDVMNRKGELKRLDAPKKGQNLAINDEDTLLHPYKKKSRNSLLFNPQTAEETRKLDFISELFNNDNKNVEDYSNEFLRNYENGEPLDEYSDLNSDRNKQPYNKHFKENNQQGWYTFPPPESIDPPFKFGLKRPSKKSIAQNDDERFKVYRDDYAYIKTNQEKLDNSIGYRILSELAKILKLPLTTLSDIRINHSEIIFRINPNLKSYDAPKIAHEIINWKSQLEKSGGGNVRIIESGVRPLLLNEDRAEKVPTSLRIDSRGDDGYRSLQQAALAEPNRPQTSGWSKFLAIVTRGGSDLSNYDDSAERYTQFNGGPELKSKILLVSAITLAALMTLVILLVLFIVFQRRLSPNGKNKPFTKSKRNGSTTSARAGLLEEFGDDGAPSGPDETFGGDKSYDRSLTKNGLDTSISSPDNSQIAGNTSTPLTAPASRYTSPKWAATSPPDTSTGKKDRMVNGDKALNHKNNGHRHRNSNKNVKNDKPTDSPAQTNNNDGSSTSGNIFTGFAAAIFGKTSRPDPSQLDETSPPPKAENTSSPSNLFKNGNHLPNGRAVADLNNVSRISSRRNTWIEDGIFNKMDATTGHIVLDYMEKRIENRRLIEDEWSQSLCSYVPAPFAELEGVIAPPQKELSQDLTEKPEPYSETELADTITQYGILRRSWAACFENRKLEADEGFPAPTSPTPWYFTTFERAENMKKLSERSANPWSVLPYLSNSVELAWTKADNEKTSLADKRRKSSNNADKSRFPQDDTASIKLPSPKPFDSRSLNNEPQDNNTAASPKGKAGHDLFFKDQPHKSFKFINASLISDSDPRYPNYIASQGPVNMDLACDFWQMVWDKGIFSIVNLTSNIEYENAKDTHFRYWPQSGVQLYSVYEVYLVSEHVWCADYIVRSFYLKNTATNDTRTLTLFHYTAWPETGVPRDTKTLLEFRRKINKSYKGRSTPIIVHCSDGSGRTGTYILIDMILSRLSKGVKQIDIQASVEFLRDQRIKMVSTKEQFEFSFLAISDEVQNILKTLYPTPTPPPSIITGSMNTL